MIDYKGLLLQASEIWNEFQSKYECRCSSSWRVKYMHHFPRIKKLEELLIIATEEDDCMHTIYSHIGAKITHRESEIKQKIGNWKLDPA